MTATVTKRDRVMAALRGDAVDRVPLSFWLHNFATENSVEEFVAEIRSGSRATFDWDYLKPQSRAQCFAEAWGLRYHAVGRAGGAVHGHPRAVRGRRRPAAPAAGRSGRGRARRAARGAPPDPRRGRARHADHLDGLLAADGRAVPAAAAAVEQALAIARAEPAALEPRSAAIAETLAGYTRLALAAGADGLFYATNVAPGPSSSRRPSAAASSGPYDLPILAAVAAAPVQPAPRLRRRRALRRVRSTTPCRRSRWAQAPGNPSLPEGRRRTGRAVVGGLPAKPVIATLTHRRSWRGHARAAVGATSGRGLLLGPDCSINPDTPEPLLHAARAARDASAAGGSARV